MRADRREPRPDHDDGWRGEQQAQIRPAIHGVEQRLWPAERVRDLGIQRRGGRTRARRDAARVREIRALERAPCIGHDERERLADELEHVRERAVAGIVDQLAALEIAERRRVGLVGRHHPLRVRREELLVRTRERDAERLRELEARRATSGSDAERAHRITSSGFCSASTSAISDDVSSRPDTAAS